MAMKDGRRHEIALVRVNIQSDARADVFCRIGRTEPAHPIWSNVASSLKRHCRRYLLREAAVDRLQGHLPGDIHSRSLQRFRKLRE